MPHHRLSTASALPLVLAFMLFGCASRDPVPRTFATALLQPTAGNAAHGEVALSVTGDVVVAKVHMEGLMPDSEHGIHVHETGNCKSSDGSSAGGHFNPTGQPHGDPGQPHHAGDMPSVSADAYGRVDTTITLHDLAPDDGPYGVVGRAVVVHADPDDYHTQPAGNSGTRISCGVVVGVKAR
jgi:Cu-Zn family superoxide dismutase